MSAARLPRVLAGKLKPSLVLSGAAEAFPSYLGFVFVKDVRRDDGVVDWNINCTNNVSSVVSFSDTWYIYII